MSDTVCGALTDHNGACATTALLTSDLSASQSYAMQVMYQQLTGLRILDDYVLAVEPEFQLIAVVNEPVFQRIL